MMVFPGKMTIHGLLIIGLFVALPKPAVADDWLDQILRFLGVSKTPSQQRSSPANSFETGDIFITTLDGVATRITTDGGYRSPVFLPGDAGLLALKGDVVVRVPFAGGAAQPLQTAPRALKLLGVDASDADRVLVLLETPDGGSEPGVLTLTNGQIEALPHDHDSKTHRRVMNQLRGDNLEREEITVYLKTESRARLGGQMEWTDVYVKRKNTPPVNVSHCDGANCGQPALSPDGQRIAFIRVGTRNE